MTDPDVAESEATAVDRDNRVVAHGSWSIRYVAETGSTNSDVFELAHGGAPDRTVLRTDHQTAGRGRLDRRWSSPPGTNLMVSLLFREVPADPTELTRRVGVAAAAAVHATTGRAVTLKWPNDLLLDGHKLAGILAQRDEATGAVAVGLGLNTSWSPDGAVDLAGAVSPADLLVELLDAYDRLPADGDSFHAAYRQQLSTLGQRVRVELPSGDLHGRAVDVDPDGRLVVVDDCAVTHRVSVGDVIHVRPVTS